jgi:hypothetical protein
VRYTWQQPLSRAAPTSAAPISERDTFAPPHDRTHQLDLLGQAMRGPYRLSVRWQYGSGLPFTQVVGFYEQLPRPTPEDPSQRDPDARRSERLARGPLYGARLPAYHRLDVSLQRVLARPRYRLRYQIGLVNAYDRANVFTVDLRTGERTDQLPLIPTVGLYVEVL